LLVPSLRLAVGENLLPDGAIVFELQATGPLVALPDSDSAVVGAFVYKDDTVFVVVGDGGRMPLFQLREWDGKPILRVK
jgi:hypothetical protein